MSKDEDKNPIELLEEQLDPAGRANMAQLRQEVRQRMERRREVEKAISEEDALEIFRIGMGITGMTEQQLRAEWQKIAEVGADAYRGHPRVVPTRDPRDVVKARGVLEKHLRAVYDQEPAPCEALDRVQACLSNASISLLVLSGGVGTRKTGSACTALLKRSGYVVMAADLASMRTSQAPDVRERFDRLHECDVLVVDDLGREFLDDKGFWFGTFESLIDRRYADELKTIMTCNLTPEKFKERYGERVADRIREAGHFAVIGGGSVRKRA